ncbi:MAG TPA: hypothetical protein VMZ27_07275, partial [Candidatus Saccharimonadales bacterium]|nr:hypothetical protein [Candidatus Saccharimonadales bacterium]
ISSNVPLAILINPAILQAPLSQTVVQGGSLTLSISVTGHPMPITYRWVANGLSIAAFTLPDTKCFLTITNVQPTATTNIFYYRVTVVNAAGFALSPLIAVTILADTDHDGIPDAWETSHQLDPGNPGDAILDSDGDGQTNLQEYRASTNPQDSNSVLRFEGITLGSNGACTLTFMARSNSTYQVEARDGLAPAPWRTIVRAPAAPADRTVDWPDNTGTNGARFYRLVTPAGN